MLDRELDRRLGLAKSAFNSLRLVTTDQSSSRLGRGTISQLINCMVTTVLLYGSEVWALTNEQLRKLDGVVDRWKQVAFRGRPEVDKAAEEEKYTKVRVPPVGTLIARRQLRWLGHLARQEGSQWSFAMLSCRRFGGGRQGRTLPARLTGVKGVYYRLLMHSNTKCLTREARKVYFAKALPLTYHNAPWTELAQNRTAWRKFANSARPR